MIIDSDLLNPANPLSPIYHDLYGDDIDLEEHKRINRVRNSVHNLYKKISENK